MVLAKGDTISQNELPAELGPAAGSCPDPAAESSLERLESDHVRMVLEKCGWNKYQLLK